MSSALAAFAQAQAAPPAGANDNNDDDAYASNDDHVAEPKPSALAAFAQKAKPLTLVDIAKDQRPPPTTTAAPSLVDVARTLDQQAVNNQLQALAADVEAEARDADERRTREIARALEVTSQQVQAEQAAARHAQVTQALAEAEDPTVERAAARVVEATAPKTTVPPKTMSVDRHVLKQRQRRPKVESHSTSKVKTLKDELSAFQFDQLSLTQQRVFLAMLVDDKKPTEPKPYNRHAIEALAKDRVTQRREKEKLLKLQPPVYAKLDDARHCRFRPKIKATGDNTTNRDRDDDDDDGGDNQRRDDFIRRMEATERVRKEQLRRTRAEREYLAQIDKKECPQCGNPQSHAELTQKRKKCPNCGVTYKSRLAWGEIANEFLARMALHLETQRANSINQKPDAVVGRPAPRWRDVRDEFLGRVQLDLAQRELTKDLILRELEAQCTFAPVISDRAKRLPLAEFDERLRRDLEARRLRQDQYRRLTAEITSAESVTGKRNKSELPEAFAARLRQDLERRRERAAANANPKTLYGPKSRGLY